MSEQSTTPFRMSRGSMDLSPQQTAVMQPLSPSLPDLASVIRIVFLIPVYNDWESVQLLLLRLNRELDQDRLIADIMLVDDGSTELENGQLNFQPSRGIEGVKILRLACNGGHQRAIAIGLSHLAHQCDHDAIIVMDGDGEDDPADVPNLIAKCAAGQWDKIVFAERTRRSEKLGFRIGYRVFQILHLVLTGVRVRVGNYSLIPRRALSRVIATPDIALHYAAAVFHAHIEHELVPTVRGKRLAGNPQMNLLAYVRHGLRALSIYSDVIGIRMLIATSTSILVTILALTCVMGVGVVTHLENILWLQLGLWILLLSLVQMLFLEFACTIIILKMKSSNSVCGVSQSSYASLTNGVVDIGLRNSGLLSKDEAGTLVDF